MNKHVPGHGNSHAELVVIGEAPSFAEVDSGLPFVGPAGRQLDSLFKDAGIERSRVWLTNACKYFVPPAPFGSKDSFFKRAKAENIDLQEQLNDLRYELSQINPKCLLILGGTALKLLTGNSNNKVNIQDYRGSILNVMGYKAVCTFHPAHLIHQAKGEIKGYWERKVMIFDMQRALVQSGFREIILPSRNLHVCQSSAELGDFIERNKASKKPAIDIEAHPNGSCIPICVGISYNPGEGITVPLWNVDDISTIPDGDLASTWLLLSKILYCNEGVIGQNFGYDRDKMRRLGLIIKKLASDTMLKAFCINPELPKNLAFLTSIYTEEPFYKNEGMYEGSIKDLLIGCARDACVTKEIDMLQDPDMDELGTRDFYEQFMLPLHDLYHKIEDEGIYRDPQIREELVKKYVKWDEEINYKLYGLSGEEHVNTSSWKQVDKLLYETWMIPKRKGTSEDVLTALLNNVIKDKNDIRREGINLILEDRRVKKTLDTYLYNLADFDGRMRTTFFLCLDTGRSSTSQQEAPIRPNVTIKRPGKQPKDYHFGVAYQTLTKHGDIGPEIRKMYRADDGYVFLQLDSSQAEARVIFKLADDEQALRDIDIHDYHALTASWFFGGLEEEYSKKVLGYEHPKRFVGKTLRHAGHLGAKAPRATIEVNTSCRKFHIDYVIKENDAEKALSIFHNRQPKIRGIYHASVRYCIDRTRQLRAPVPYGINAKIGGVRTFFERNGDELYRQAYSYLPQRTVSENTKGAALRIKAKHDWIRICMESHDALLLHVPISRKYDAAMYGREEMQRPINFETCSIPRGELVIPCDVEEGYDYFDFKKFKFEKVA